MNFYQKLISDLEKQLFSLHPDAELTYNVIKNMRQLANAPDGFLNPDSPLVYDNKLPVFGKIMFALKYRKQMSRVSDIEQVIKQFEPNFKKGLSTPLQKLKKSGAIFNVNTTGSNKTVWYGLLGWVDENGKIKEDYYMK